MNFEELHKQKYLKYKSKYVDFKKKFNQEGEMICQTCLYRPDLIWMIFLK